MEIKVSYIECDHVDRYPTIRGALSAVKGRRYSRIVNAKDQTIGYKVYGRCPKTEGHTTIRVVEGPPPPYFLPSFGNKQRRMPNFGDRDTDAEIADKKLKAEADAKADAKAKIDRITGYVAGRKITEVAEWRSIPYGQWVVAVTGHKIGDVVAVRTKAGKVSNETLAQELAPNVYRVA